MKRLQIVIIFAVCFLTGSCQSTEEKDTIGKSNTLTKLEIPFNVLLQNMGEPTGEEVKRNSFYLIFYHSIPYQKLELFTIRQTYDAVYFCHKITDDSNVRLLSNEDQQDSSIHYYTSFKNIKNGNVSLIKKLIEDFKIKELNNTKGKIESAFHAEYLGLLIYDGQSLIRIDRLAYPKETEKNFNDFFNVIRDKYFNK